MPVASNIGKAWRRIAKGGMNAAEEAAAVALSGQRARAMEGVVADAARARKSVGAAGSRLRMSMGGGRSYLGGGPLAAQGRQTVNAVVDAGRVGGVRTPRPTVAGGQEILANARRKMNGRGLPYMGGGPHAGAGRQTADIVSGSNRTFNNMPSTPRVGGPRKDATKARAVTAPRPRRRGSATFWAGAVGAGGLGLGYSLRGSGSRGLTTSSMYGSSGANGGRYYG